VAAITAAATMYGATLGFLFSIRLTMHDDACASRTRSNGWTGHKSG
jgi:hypothetical protein